MSESQDLLYELEAKYQNEQSALFQSMLNDWTLGNCEMDVVLHNNQNWHGLTKDEIQAVHDDFVKLVKTHQQETEENFDLVRTIWEDNIPK